MSFEPQFETHATGRVVAKFKLPATSENIAKLTDWLKQNRWRGALIANFSGNGGISDIQFAETPKVLREDKS